MGNNITPAEYYKLRIFAIFYNLELWLISGM